jgi:anthranilate synthase component 2
MTARPDVLLLDSRDSFTFNLSQGFAELGASVDVVLADDVDVEAVRRRAPKLVCIGPGPRGPTELPHLVALAGALSGVVPIFGVCLGLQVLVRAHGGTVARAKEPMHGKRHPIVHDDVGVLAGLPNPLWVMRYHSLTATTVPTRFVVTARDRDGQVMALRDAQARIEAVQFHPESIGTAGGMEILSAALALAGVASKAVHARRGSVPGAHAAGPRFPEAVYRHVEG